MTSPKIIMDVLSERRRQKELQAAGKFRWTAADPGCSDLLRLAMLTEEIGEVARAMQNSDEANLKDELVQVCAIAFAWLEYVN